MQLAPIERLNRPELTEKEFKIAVNSLFEPSKVLAEKLYQRRPYETYQQLIECAEWLCRPESGQLTQEELVDVINAHPRLGAAPSQLSALSLREQGYSNFTQQQQQQQTDEDQVNLELMKLNKEYEEKFGFKCVIFVNGRPRRQLLPVIQSLISTANGREGEEDFKTRELKRGLEEMMLIARDRLKKLISH